MKNLEAITQMSAKELKTLEKGIHEISRATGLASAELADSAKMVAEAGGDLDLMMAQLTHGTNLAIATKTDLATTLDMVGSAMKTFRMGEEATQAVVDSLAATTQKANVTLAQLGESYKNAGGAAAQAGLSINDVNAILIAFKDRGMLGADAGTKLKMVLQSLLVPSSEAKATLEALGVAIYDSQ